MRVFCGEAIREMRKLKGWTQEVLAENICATSTLSKIENGHCVPYRKTYLKLMNKLGGNGISYDELCIHGGYHQERLRRELIVAMENNEIDRAEDKLMELSDILDRNLPENIQLIEAMNLLLYRLKGYEGEDFRKNLTNILYMTRSAEELLHNNPFSMRLSETELLILNNIALSYLKENNPSTALRIYEIMAPNFVNRLDSVYADFSRAALFNNIAICLAMTNQYVVAMEYCDRGISIAKRRGGLVLLYNLYSLKKRLYLSQGQDDKAWRVNEILDRTKGILTVEEDMTFLSDKTDVGLGICIL